MGKWASYRKRGSSSGRPGPSGPPPAPVTGFIGDNIFIQPQGEDDTGGTLSLQVSSDGGLTWTLVDIFDWVTPYGPINPDDYTPGWLRSKESGNGIAYVGTSPYGNILVLP